MQTYNITCLSEAISPISHMSGTAGNEGIVAREPVITPKGKMYVPCLSGNAIRHRLIREPGAKWMIDRLELRGKLTLPMLNFLYHGGNLSESTAHENTTRIAQMHACFPLLRLCGGSLPNQILAGCFDSWRGVLLCEENRNYLEATCSEALPSRRLRPAEEFIGNAQYTRGDAGKKGEVIVGEGEEVPTNLMIFSGQMVARGAMFLHGFTLKHCSRVDLGCLLLSLQLWQANGGTIGGQAARGHGRLKTSLVFDCDQDDLVNEYVAHVDEHKQDAIDWLFDAFAKRAEKPAKKAKVKA